MSDLRKRFIDEDDKIESIELRDGHRERFLDKLNKSENKSYGQWWKVAAGLIFILASSVIYWTSKDFVDAGAHLAQEEVQEVKEGGSIPLEDATYFYKQAIDAQFAQLEEFYGDTDSKELIEQTKLLIKELQIEYEKLEEDLEASGEERIVIAMIGNYKKRIELLEELIEKLKYIKQIKLEQNENTDQNA